MKHVLKFLTFIVGITSTLADCGFADSAYSLTSVRVYPLGSPDVSDLRPQNGGHSFIPADAYSDSTTGGDKFFLEVTLTLDQFRSNVPVTGVKLVSPSSAISGFKVQFNQVSSSWDSVTTTPPDGTETRLATDVTTHVILVFVSDNLVVGSSTGVEILVPCTVPGSYEIESPATECDEGWRLYDGNCYNFVVQPEKRWWEAQAECDSLSASLLQVNTNAELLWIRTILLDDANGLNAQTRFWTDGKLDVSDNKWKWSKSGDFITTLDWGENEPNNHKGFEGCLNMLKLRKYKNNDSKCKQRQGYVCKKQL